MLKSALHAERPGPVVNRTDGRGRRWDAKPRRQTERKSDAKLAHGVNAGIGGERGRDGSAEDDRTIEQQEGADGIQAYYLDTTGVRVKVRGLKVSVAAITFLRSGFKIIFSSGIQYSYTHASF